MAKRSSNRHDGAGGIIPSLLGLVALIAVARGAWRRPAPGRATAIASEPAAPASGVGEWIRRVDRWQGRRRGWSFLFAVVKKFGDDGAGYLAALVSYFAFFSVLPLFLALTSILGFVLQDNVELQNKIQDSAFEQIPLIGPQIRNNVGELNGSVLAILVGVTASIWGGLRVVDAIQNALNEVWDVPRANRPNIVKRRAKGLLALGVFGLGLIASLAATALSGLLLDLPGAGRFGLYAVTLVFNVGLFLLAFQVLSASDHRWRDLIPGAVVAAVGWFLMQSFGAVYLQRVIDRAATAYSQFAGVIGVLTFFFIVSQIVIFAAEVNVVRARRLWPRTLVPAPGHLTEADRRAFADYAGAERRIEGEIVEIGFVENGSRAPAATSNGAATTTAGARAQAAAKAQPPS